MEISDIMIGDWVCYKNIPHKVIKIVKRDVILNTPNDDDEDYIIANIDNCTPITLTCNMLVEYGFFESKEKYVLDSQKDMIVLMYKEDEDNFTMSIGLYMVNFRINFVHQLQHILKIFGYSSNFNLNVKNCEYLINDWVLYNGEYCVISEIEEPNENSEFYRYCVKSSNDSVHYCFYNDLEPISINSELLKINGFYEQQSDGSLMNIRLNDNMHYSMSFSKFGKWTIQNIETNESYEGYIQYFHQLQNICETMKIEMDFTPTDKKESVEKALDAACK